MKIRRCILFVVFTGFVMGGCTSAPTRHDEPASLVGLRDQVRSFVIRRGDGTGVVSWEEVVSDLASADVVLFGEMHGHRLGNAIAQELWEDILVHRPMAVLSMEFYERDQQLALDDYLSSVTDRTQFEKAAHRNPGNNPPGHKRMIDAAKEAHRPVIGANAPRRYVTIARKKGYDELKSLDGLQRTMFSLPMGDQEGAYKDRFMELMSGMMGHDTTDIANGMFRSQSVWDATMAQSIVDGLKLGSPVAHVVGYFHVQFGAEKGGSGLIDQIRARWDRPLKIVTIIPITRDDQPLFRGSDDVLDDDGNVVQEGEDSDLGIADYVVYVGADKEDNE